MEVSEQVTLARLPRNPQGPPNVNFGTAWGWRNGVKRKRHEICAAVEGNCVNIYEAQSGQVVLSHAVPPTSIFSGPPCSLRWKEDGTIHRQICYITAEEGLVLHMLSTKGNENGRATSVQLKTSSSPVVHLDIVKEGASISTIVLQQDGTMSTVAGDLKTVRSGKALLREPDSMDVMAASVMSASHAQKTILRARTDLLNRLDAETQVVVTISDSPDASTLQKNVIYAAWAISPFEQRSIAGKLDVQPLFQHNLSQIATILDATNADIISAKFDNRTTAIDITIANGLVRFDLSATVPRPLPTVSHLLGDSSDSISLSPSHLMVGDAQSLRIVDVNYSTIQSKTLRNLKRKKSSPSSGQSLQFITFLGGINRLLARDGQNLIAITLSLGSTGRMPVSTLASNIGRGVRKAQSTLSGLDGLELAVGGVSTFQPLPSDWKENLQGLLERSDISGFEDVLVQSFNLKGSKISRGRFTQALPDEVLDFVLERMFKLEHDADQRNETAKLRLRFVSPTLVGVLGRSGALRVPKLQRILQLKSSSKTVLLPSDAIIMALFKADASLELTQIFAKSFCSPEAREAAVVLQFLVCQAQTHGDEAVQQPRLPAMESTEDMEIDSLQATDADKRSGPIPVNLEACLVPIMERFGAFPTPAISSNLKAVLAKNEVYTLVGLLRLQLFHAGHTGSISLGEVKGDSTPRVSLQSAVAILSACVDAFGPLDLVSRGIEDEMVEQFVPQLLSEIAMVTQYVDESADLQGIIRETLRYAESQQVANPDRKAITGEADQPRRRGEIVTLYAQRTEDEDINGFASALPLSLRADDAIKATKVRKGGGQIKKRSQREMLMLQSRQKGPYTFERLIL